jgi:hypothetical protein
LPLPKPIEPDVTVCPPLIIWTVVPFTVVGERHCGNSQIEITGRHLIKLGQTAVEHDALAADQVDSTSDQFHGYAEARGRK